jgi:hypothetical protein
MRILVTGATGLIGNALIPLLEARGHEILRLTRHASRESDIEWNPEADQLDLSGAGKLNGVVHLAGENIAEGRWTHRKKERILSSRKNGTRLLSDALAAMAEPPGVLVSASGINYYGTHTDSERIDEDSPAGTGFLSEVCQKWEQATFPAGQAGIRVCRLRIGMVLTPAGGALKKMITPFRLGLGGRIGNGRQRTGWITIDDLTGMIEHALGDERWQGAVNAVAQKPVSNSNFTKQLARALRRPAIFPVPALLVRILFGEMANDTVLADLPVYSRRLIDLDYKLRHPELAGALEHLLGQAKA